MNMKSVVRWLRKTVCFMLPRKNVPMLSGLAKRYEDELCDRTFVYTFQESNKEPFKVHVEFERSGFCHLFSIGSLVKNMTKDTSEFSGMKGWKNIKNGTLTFAKLSRVNPDEFNYYEPEYRMIEEMIETARKPNAVRFIKSKLPDSRLQADILLWRTFEDKTVHIALSKGKDGWFARSYFVRDNARDKQYPTKYIYGMPVLKARTSVKY